jgi:hypothetical protein
MITLNLSNTSETSVRFFFLLLIKKPYTSIITTIKNVIFVLVYLYMQFNDSVYKFSIQKIFVF